jgi:hypothetical protein
VSDSTFPDGVNSDTAGDTWNPSAVTGDNDAAKNAWKNGDGDGQGWKNVYASSDDDSSSDKPTPKDVTAPTLTLKDSDWPLPATGHMDGNGSGKPPTNAPDVPEFSVTVETLRDAQTAVLPSADTATTKYNSLKDSTNAKKSWIFQQASADQNTNGVVIYAGTTGNDFGPDTGTGASNLDPDLTKQTPIMTASLDNALLAIADAVHLAGEYAGFLNTAAQSYVYADKESYLKAPTYL